MRAKRVRRTVKITTLLMCSVIGSAALLNSCKKEEPNPNSFVDNGMYTTKSSFSCETDCIEIGGPYFEETDQKTITYGSNTKTIDVVYFNTETDFVVKVRSTKQWSDLEINGIDVWTGSPVAANTWGVYTSPLPVNWEACDLMDFDLRVIGSGPAVTFDVIYDLIGICQGCETGFSGEAISCGTQREAVYTFTSEEALDYIKIQGGLTNFTGADAVVTVTGGNLTVSQWTPGGSSNRVIRLEGSVDECEEVTIRITWNSTNSGGIITGDWSVKDADGNEIAPYVAGLECN